MILEEEGEEGGHGPVLAAAYEGRQQTFRHVLGCKESGGEERENKEEALFELFTLLVYLVSGRNRNLRRNMTLISVPMFKPFNFLYIFSTF